MEPRYRHFADPATVDALIAEITTRHRDSYATILDRMAEQIRGFFQRSFASETEPSRFAQAQSPLVRPRVLVGLSGGIDSAVVAFLAVRALGRDAVLPVTMPARLDDESRALAALVRQALGFDEPGAPYVIDIQPIIQAHRQVMGAPDAPWAPEHLGLGSDHAGQNREQLMRSGNFASRVRVAVLSDLQRSIRGRILGTVNRTEYCQGYSTKHGTPVAYDFGILDELYKIEVYALGRLLGVPAAILDVPPSTGYFAGQTHADELGATIEEQDIFAYLLFERGLSPAAIAETYGASERFARVIRHRYDVSEHKRVLNGLQEHVRVTERPLPL